VKQGYWIATAVGIVLILVGVTVILMFVPAEPALSISRGNLTPTETVPAPTIPVAPTETIPVPGVPATPTTPPLAASTTSPGSVCGSGSMSLMALGESQPPRGTDAIRLVRVDFDRKTIDILAIPSELWVTTPGLSGQGIAGASLNQVYLQGKTSATGDEKAHMLTAVNLFASTLQANFGYLPEHYFVIKEAAFSEYVDALNGVDVVLPVAVDGRAQGMGYYPAGLQHLTGAMTLDLVRISGASEWDLFNRQQLIIQAIYQSLLTPQNWARLPALVEDIHDDVFTDLSVSQMVQMSCIVDQPGLVVNQEQVGPRLVAIQGPSMLPSPGLGPYILQTVGK